MATLKISVDIGTLRGHKEIEVEVDLEDYTYEGEISHKDLGETAEEILFDRLISWDWQLLGDDGEPIA